MLGSTLLVLVVVVVVVLVAAASGTAAGRRVKHVVVLMLENRSFDHLLGWAKVPGVDGLRTGEAFNYVNASAPSPSSRVFATPTAPQIAGCDPDHSTPPTTEKIFGLASVAAGNLSVATMGGFVETAKSLGRGAALDYCGVMSGQPPAQVPVSKWLAEQYAVADRFFASHPGPTWPNRQFALCATSGGNVETSVWYRNKGQLFPQKTIFDQVEAAGLDWQNVVGDAPWETFMTSVAHHPEKIRTMPEFFAQAKEGVLPAFTWINPRAGVDLETGYGSNDNHPDHDVALGEALLADVYNALRDSPAWEDTAFILTYDEHGGFFDHVPTPLKGIPAPGDETWGGYPTKFNFTRLGLRVPLIIMSPFIPAGTVLHDPPAAQKPQPTSLYDQTSVIATARKLLGIDHITGSLTQRDAWAGTFEHLLSLSTPRTDAKRAPNPPAPIQPFAGPVVLGQGAGGGDGGGGGEAGPTDPTVGSEARQPMNSLQREILTVLEHLAEPGQLSGPPAHVRDQGAAAARLRDRYRRHAERTLRWKASRAQYTVLVALSNWPASNATPVADDAWTVGRGVEAEPATHFDTFSTRKLHDPFGDPYCLTAGDGSSAPAAGANVTVSVCYPSPNPAWNRDPAQQWVYDHENAFIRFSGDTNLCVTAPNRAGAQVTLEPCTGTAQGFAYWGKAPGNPGGGQLSSGVGSFHLFVTPTNPQQLKSQ